MPKSSIAIADGEKVAPDGSLVLATFERSERVRVLIRIGEFEGRRRVDIRTWRAGIRGVDAFIPTYKGAAILPHELDDAIAALTRARELIAAAGEGGHHAD